MEERQETRPLLSSANGEDNNLSQTRNSQNIVSFQKHDPDNPLEWSKRYKWLSVLQLVLIAFVTTYAAIGIVPVAGDIVKELEGHKDREASFLFVTIWEIGEAMGPLFLAPLSENYGRFIVYNVANCFFIAGIALAACSQSIGVLIFARLATGCAVAANVLNPAIIGDMFPSESRGAAMSAVMMAPLLGGAVGPTLSGMMADNMGWRAIMWLCMGLAGAFEIVFFTYLQETYPPVILNRRAAKKRKETSDDSYTTEYEEQQGDQSKTKMLLRRMFRPAGIIWSSTMLQCLSLWGGLMFAFFYVNSTSLPDILQEVYGFDPTQRGLAYLSWSLGSVISILTCNRAMDKIYNKLGKSRGREHYPEGRVPLLIVAAILLPIAVLLYGWTAELQASVWVFLCTPCALCIAVVFAVVPLMTFITDAFGDYSASAITAVLVIRCLLGALLPLVVPPVSAKAGYGWAFTLLASLALVFAPVPCLVMRYGPTWRQRSEYTKDR